MNGTCGPKSGYRLIAISPAVGGAAGWAGDMVQWRAPPEIDVKLAAALRGGVVGLHPGERLFHFAEDPNRVGNQIRRTIAFEPRDQLSPKSQDSPLRELHQAGDADSDRPSPRGPLHPN